MISSLKEGSGLDTLDGSGAVAMELEDLRHEKELQREDIQKLQGQVHTLRIEIQVRCFKWQTIWVEEVLIQSNVSNVDPCVVDGLGGL